MKAGTTGDFSSGKLNESDKGGLTIGIGVEAGRVIIDFGVSPDQALAIASSIGSRALALKNLDGRTKKAAALNGEGGDNHTVRSELNRHGSTVSLVLNCANNEDAQLLYDNITYSMNSGGMRLTIEGSDLLVEGRAILDEERRQ